VIRNLPYDVIEQDVLNLINDTFHHMAKSQGHNNNKQQQQMNKIISYTVAAHRGLAFIDFATAQPCQNLVSFHAQEPLKLSGRPLHLYQKSSERPTGGYDGMITSSSTTGGSGGGGGSGGSTGYRKLDSAGAGSGSRNHGRSNTSSSGGRYPSGSGIRSYGKGYEGGNIRK
jgi:hypothetical protein